MPTIQALAANAVMAGCKPEYFPAVTAALRGVLDPEYHLHGTLAYDAFLRADGDDPAGRSALSSNINCGTNCFGQGRQANATIGRALGLMLLRTSPAPSPAKWTARPRAILPSSLSASARTRKRSLGALSRAARLRAHGPRW